MGSDMRNLVSVGKICFLCLWPSEDDKYSYSNRTVKKMVDGSCVTE